LKHSKNVAIFGISILAALLMVGLVANQAMAAPPSPKVTICHVMSSHDITITVGTTSVKAHLDHGDHIGACNSCGDGNLDDKEQSAGYCDDGNNDNTDACTNTCAVAACGDGYTQAGEACDDGNTTGGDGCDATCQTEPVCGNSIIEAGETCDGANLGGETCSSQGFTSGILSCKDNCTLDTSACSIPE
jgi:cysteine-rich repeat protein